MESAAEILKMLGNGVLKAGVFILFAGGFAVFWMIYRSAKHTRQSKATKLDALFLSLTSPGFSRFSILNASDDFGLGIYAVLALEQVGAVKDAKAHVEANQHVYPGTPSVYATAARYYALIGDKQKARDLLSVAGTLEPENNKNYIPQIDVGEVEKLINSDTKLQNTTSIDAIYEEIHKKPLQLLLARSKTVAIGGLCLILGGFVLLMISNLFK